MNLAIDTNRYRDLRDGLPEALTIIESASAVFVPFVVIAELKIGFGQGARRANNERLLENFLRKPAVQIALPDELTLETYASLFLDLKARGRPIPINDLWIAALCVQHGLTLYTRDKHFDHLPQVAQA
ncbi:MAG: type II toxin-antitoxin system VapC family toxin [Tepidisphaeraceae bacterium]